MRLQGLSNCISLIQNLYIKKVGLLYRITWGSLYTFRATAVTPCLQSGNLFAL